MHYSACVENTKHVSSFHAHTFRYTESTRRTNLKLRYHLKLRFLSKWCTEPHSFTVRSQRSKGTCQRSLSVLVAGMGIKCRSQPQDGTVPVKRTHGFVLFKGRLQGTGLSNALIVITISMQRMRVLSLTGKPCNINVYRTLHIRILTVKPNSCGQEKKKKNCVNTKWRFRCSQNLSRVCSTSSEIVWFSLPFKNDSVFITVNLKVRSTSYTCFILCSNLENMCVALRQTARTQICSKKEIYLLWILMHSIEHICVNPF